MTGQELANKCIEIKNNYKTKYAKGTFGQCATPSFINQKAKQYPAWYKGKIDSLLALPNDTRLFDCVGLIKAVMWGFPNAVYTSNGFKDYYDQTLWEACTDRKKEFSNVQIGECLWIKGHVGVYIGNGMAIECTNTWSGNVQITAVLNIGKIAGLNGRKWTGHGKIPTVVYNATEGSNSGEKPKDDIITTQKVYYVKKGDTLSSIAKANGMSLAKLISYNPQIKNINVISIGQKVYLTTDVKEEYYIVKSGDTLNAIARKYNMALSTLLGLNPDIKNPNIIKVGDKIRIK